MKQQERDGFFAERHPPILSTKQPTGLEAAERSLTRYVGELDSGLGRDAMALFRSVAPLLVELPLVPESIRTYAAVQR